MALTIWKYPLEVCELQRLEVPSGSQIMCVREHGVHSQPHAWIACNPDEPKATMTLVMCGTGHPLPSGEYVGTAFQGGFVWHYFKQ